MGGYYARPFFKTSSMSQIKPAGGSAIQNGTPNANFTRAQIAQFIDSSANNALSFAIYRNPSTVYKYIKANYGKEYPTLISGAETTMPQMESMMQFLSRKYNDLPAQKRRHFLGTIFYSLPAQAQFMNWTTPVEDKK